MYSFDLSTMTIQDVLSIYNAAIIGDVVSLFAVINKFCSTNLLELPATEFNNVVRVFHDAYMEYFTRGSDVTNEDITNLFRRITGEGAQE